MTPFSLAEAAQRYDRFRPKVHNITLEWLRQAAIDGPFLRALDVACGTGDSTVPLLDLAHEVIGIDQSEAMLHRAREKGLETAALPYHRAAELGTFDLISTCMAFHWFNRDEAINAYKAASKSGAVWLIYNFGFGGSRSNADFNRWFVEDYLSAFPSPPRQSTMVNIEEDPSLSLLYRDQGSLPIAFSQADLVGYLTTQSNVEAQVQEGQSYEAIEQRLQHELGAFGLDTEFKYNFQVEIYRYLGSE